LKQFGVVGRFWISIQDSLPLGIQSKNDNNLRCISADFDQILRRRAWRVAQGLSSFILVHRFDSRSLKLLRLGS